MSEQNNEPEKDQQEIISTDTKQFSTFVVADRLYGINVMKVQEVTREMPITPVPLSPSHVSGLINLRGQIATAINLRDLFKLESDEDTPKMNVICEIGDVLISLLVDKIGDVIEINNKSFESTPETIPQSIRQYMEGVYKISGSLLSILDIEKLISKIEQKNENNSI